MTETRVVDNEGDSRYEVLSEGKIAGFAEYRRAASDVDDRDETCRRPAAAGAIGSPCLLEDTFMVTLEEIRELALSLPRTTEHLIRDWVKFRIKSIVYLSISPDETVMGFGFPKDEREALVAAEPAKFHLPRPSDMRFNWVHVSLAAIDAAELSELVIDSWRMCVPKRVAAAHLNLGS